MTGYDDNNKPLVSATNQTSPDKGVDPAEQPSISEREGHEQYIQKQFAKKELAVRKREAEMALRIFIRAEKLRGIRWSRDQIAVVEEPKETEEPDKQTEQALKAKEEAEKVTDAKQAATLFEMLESLGGVAVAPGESVLSLLENDDLVKAAQTLLANPEDEKTYSRLELLEKLIEQISLSSFDNNKDRMLGIREKSRLEQIKQLLQYLRNWKQWHDRVNKDIDSIVERRVQKYKPKRKKK